MNLDTRIAQSGVLNVANGNVIPKVSGTIEVEMSEKMKIVFAPGCFDGFEGTQEELNELIDELTRMAENGDLMNQARPVDVDDEELYTAPKAMATANRRRLN